ncbi:MAG: glycosyltransferase family 9 protein [Candidatus Tectimicrobiota bacterium]
MQRILVIRGGAVGDMVVTLPALAALRAAFPQATIELLGQPERARLARHPHYVDQVTALERWDIYRLFGQSPTVSSTLATYLRSWDVILSYLPAPEATFVNNVQRYCAGEVYAWWPHPPAQCHVTAHLCQPVLHWQPPSCDLRPHLYLETEAQERAAQFWQAAGLPEHGVVAWHPGSGGSHKLWPLAGWREVMTRAARQGLPGVLISGPAESERLSGTEGAASLPPWPRAQGRSLTEVAAILARCAVVVGHDSGISHLAAAVGTTVLACFGPTDPYVWGPRSPRACVLWPEPAGPLTLQTLPPAMVSQTLETLLRGSFAYTPSPVDCTIVRL